MTGEKSSTRLMDRAVHLLEPGRNLLMELDLFNAFIGAMRHNVSRKLMVGMALERCLLRYCISGMQIRSGNEQNSSARPATTCVSPNRLFRPFPRRTYDLKL